MEHGALISALYSMIGSEIKGGSGGVGKYCIIHHLHGMALRKGGDIYITLVTKTRPSRILYRIGVRGSRIRARRGEEGYLHMYYYDTFT